MMAGSADGDVFVFTALGDSGTATGLIDNIDIFLPGGGGDRIDLSQIDARTGTAAFEHFDYIGTAAFSHAGQLRVVQSGSSAFVLINAAGANGAEMKICLVGVDAATLKSQDFIL